MTEKTWRKFEFGPELRLREVGTASGELVKGKAKEWVLEVIFGLNLDVLMPEIHPRMVSMSTTNDDWGATDLVAVDRMRGIHLFEMKYDTSSSDALIQVVGYGIRTLASSQGVPDGAENVLGKVHRCLRDELGWTVEGHTLVDAHAERLDAAFAGRERSCPAPCIHFHVVAPNIHDRSELARLARNLYHWAHTPIWLWDARLEVHPTGGGVLHLREVSSSAHQMGKKKLLPYPWTVYGLVCRAAGHFPALIEWTWRLFTSKGVPALRTKLRRNLLVDLKVESGHAAIYLWRENACLEDEGHQLGELLCQLGSPTQSDRQRIEQGADKPLDWSGEVDGQTFKVCRSGSKLTQGSVIMPVDSMEKTGELIARLFSVIVGHLEQHPEAFTQVVDKEA